MVLEKGLQSVRVVQEDNALDQEMAQKVEALDRRRYRRQTKQGGCRPVIYLLMYTGRQHVLLKKWGEELNG